ncbi:unnamed protein product [Adineta steineri]|uniref:G-protein coupled receptors family 1 profile domain-containing protein n=1 Tax=Adineta steineri TaxID=433720 RepID=A0A815RK96_9BILA|nr:unnamed protein product [Adineta steineri]CAF3958706.1 unnamed protein product [Adineta steineri]
MEDGIVGFVLSLISLIHGSFGSVISILIFLLLIFYQYKNDLKKEERINLFLFTTIYFYLFIYILTLTSFNIQTILGDLYGMNFNSSWCTFRGYLIPVSCSALYQTFVIQAFFRLCRIVYSTRRWLQFFWFYVLFLPIELMFASVLLCPILIWKDIDYSFEDNYCFVPLSKARGIIWLVFTTYAIPLMILFLIYIRIIIYIRHLPTNQPIAMRRRQKRDLIAIQRICINISLLLILVIPGTILILMKLLGGIDYPLTYRILWVGVEISVAILTIEMIFTTPQLKNIFLKRFRQNRVATLIQSTQRELANTNTNH